jgi:hypothetical protein
MSDAMISTPAEIKPGSEKGADQQDHLHDDRPSGSEHHPPTHLVTPAELAAQLHANPKLAALRSPMAMTPLQPSSTKAAPPISPPILINLKCSGYFVEPVGVDSFIVVRLTDALVEQMKWMEFFLESGQLAGKIICPETKCGAKLGNFDWAGVRCGCKEWVTPVGIRSELVICTPESSYLPRLLLRDSASIDRRWTRLCENVLPKPTFVALCKGIHNHTLLTNHWGFPSGDSRVGTYLHVICNSLPSQFILYSVALLFRPSIRIKGKLRWFQTRTYTEPGSLSLVSYAYQFYGNIGPYHLFVAMSSRTGLLSEVVFRN